MFGRLWSRDQRRDIFHYFDGTDKRRADPLALMTRIEDDCPDFADLLSIIAAGEEGGLSIPSPGVKAEMSAAYKSALAKLLAVVRKAFGVKPLDQSGGLTDAETLQLFTRYLVFMGELAEAARPLPDSPPVESPSLPAASPTA